MKRAIDWKDYPKRQDENGRWLCRWCGGVCPGRRTAFCSDDCEKEILIRARPGYAASLAYERDGGRCVECGFDCDRAEKILRRNRGKWYQHVFRLQRGKLLPLHHRMFYAYLRRHGVLPLKAMNTGHLGWLSTRHLSECDHVIPVAEGGGGCGLDNLRTLCLRCHREATRDLHRRLKARRVGATQEMICVGAGL